MDSLTNLSTIRDLCQRHDFTFSKSHGQHFLINPGICPKIADVAGIDEESEIFEIGPGFGTLSRELASRGGTVVAVEKDARLLPVLAETMHGYDNFTVLQDDVLETDLAALFAQRFKHPVKVCANLPYNITSPVITGLLETPLPIDTITVMVQKEAARRLCAAPGTRESGAISYLVHYYTKPTYAFTVKPGSFYPAPRVDSGVIHLTLRTKRPFDDNAAQKERLFKLIRAGFGQRRKTLANAASAGLDMDKDRLLEALTGAEIDTRVRPEALTLEQFITLTNRLWPAK